MIEKADAICQYIRAKDGNRPHLLEAAFSESAILHMQIRPETISFPSKCMGRDEIVEVFIRQFNQTYENIYTFCIVPKPNIETDYFRCRWMVVMSEKESHALRVGSGEYVWQFDRSGRVHSLNITIESMESTSSKMLVPVMQWVSTLPYPWCDLSILCEALPNVVAVENAVRSIQERE